MERRKKKYFRRRERVGRKEGRKEGAARPRRGKCEAIRCGRTEKMCFYSKRRVS